MSQRQKYIPLQGYIESGLMNKYKIIFIFLLFPLWLAAQKGAIDSLRYKALHETGENKIYAYYDLAEAFVEINIDSSIFYAQKLSAYADSISDDFGKGMASFILGTYFDKAGRYAAAIQNQKEALRYFQKMKDTALIAKTYINLGIEFQILGNYETSLHYFQSAEELEKKTNDAYIRALVLSNTGSLYEDWKRYGTALEYFRSALRFARKAKVKELEETILHNMGVEYNFLKQYHKARQYLDSALLICRQLQWKEGQFYVYYDYGDSFLGEQNIPDAEKMFYQALSIAKSLDNQLLIAKSYFKLGEVYDARNDYDSAVENLKKALKISRELRENKLTKDILLLLSRTLKTAGMPSEAYDYYQQYALVKDSLFQDRSQKLLVDMEVKYETDKKEKEIQIKNLLLEKQKDKYIITLGISIGIFILFALLGLLIFNRYKYRQRKQQHELEKKNIEIEQRLLRTQMNPHFIFNSLNSISNFILHHQAGIAQNYLSKFARLMRLILNNSREKMVPLEDEIETLELYLSLERLRFNEIFDYVIEISPEIDPEFTYVPPMLIQPFVENAILHGLRPKQEKGHIRLQIGKEGKSLKVVIEDDGIGRKEAAKRKQQTTRRKSLGMQVTKERLEMLSKETGIQFPMEIIDLEENGVAKGTKVILHIPFEEE